MSLPLDERFPAEPAALRALRTRVRGALQGLALPGHDAETVLLVVDELVSNAIEHGSAYRSGGTPLRVRLEAAGDDLLLEFADADMPSDQIAAMARAFAATDLELPDLEDERGRGMFLILTALHGIRIEDRSASGGGMLLVGRFKGMGRQ
ncbi:MAG TPA: ATP-binding protein [Planctomycetota bacterium]|nr:ATP-binding protein [Planctomycetota bacterium]